VRITSCGAASVDDDGDGLFAIQSLGFCKVEWPLQRDLTTDKSGTQFFIATAKYDIG